jgi:hypothetical protein
VREVAIVSFIVPVIVDEGLLVSQTRCDPAKAGDTNREKKPHDDVERGVERDKLSQPQQGTSP